MLSETALEIIYQDSDYIAVHKPPRLLVHRTNLDPHTLITAVQILEDQLGQKVYPVHRLDRPTSGVLIFALSSESARDLAKKFESREVEKTYLAIVRGELKNKILVDYPLNEELDKISDKQARTDKPAQAALTFIKPLAQIDIPICVDRYPSSRYSLVLAYPKTGRKHQIRRHLRHLGHPVIGDVNHGVGKHNRFFREYFQSQRLLLACTGMQFKHPKTQQIIHINAKPSADFHNLADRLGWSPYL